MKNNLLKLQNNYFNASVENVKEGNLAIRKAQGWVLTLGLAELAFLGTQGDFSLISNEIAISFLFLSFILFSLGSIKQSRNLFDKAKYYKRLSNETMEWILKNKIIEIENIPKELKEETEISMASNKTADKFIFLSFILIGLSSLIIWFNLIS